MNTMTEEQQRNEIASRYPAAIVIMQDPAPSLTDTNPPPRYGRVYAEDAEIVKRYTDGESQIAWSNVNTTISKLIQAGYKVIVAERIT